MSAPQTYTEAAKVAVEITQAELVAALQAYDNPYVYRPNSPRHIAMGLRVHFPDERYAFVGYDYCDRKGYTRTDGTASLSGSCKNPIFELADGTFARVASEV